MKYIADLHLHSRFSRATSNKLDLPNLEKYGKIKGLNLLGTGDFMHPQWQKELKSELTTDGSGIYKTKSRYPFVLSNEISLMYRQGDKGRRAHVVLLAPNMDVVDQITDYFKKFGRVDYDGRPIFGKSIIEVTEGLNNISNDIEIIPAHIWTPWFGLLGSKSGFDSFKEALGDQIKHIHSFETGLSSDPEMNWRVSELDKFTALSFSDAHSHWPWRIGREATLFDLKNLTYKDLINAIRTRDGYEGTIEVDPGYGRYHHDGHRNCGVSFIPQISKKYNDICPVCKKPLTIGVMYRVEELADRPEGYTPKNAAKVYKLLPLSDLISGVVGTGVATQKVWEIFNKLIDNFGSEYNVLLNVSADDLQKVVDENIVQFILKNRAGQIEVKPGYDGVYGEAIFGEKPQPKPFVSERPASMEQQKQIEKPQKSLTDF
ncbi:DNA helicase UvrD [Candidatus Woesearchaeota archaeon]|jgi:uncharacterized protein (TIGR00375 family)|nr:DNA helicase UvrD [Candidatus Woesearchaeota archaeon]MBT7062604.1 DNA helicase UvrD [Candidatus Woesearchaeota archaeon]MBT7402763.1 DNA helicase UvrD [Candidatus Woesearchaeota archaeon]